MNQGTDVTRYLTNSVATDLQLHYGYFAVKMRGPSEASLSVLQGFGAESAYFSQQLVAYCRTTLCTAPRNGPLPLTVGLYKDGWHARSECLSKDGVSGHAWCEHEGGYICHARDMRAHLTRMLLALVIAPHPNPSPTPTSNPNPAASSRTPSS